MNKWLKIIAIIGLVLVVGYVGVKEIGNQTVKSINIKEVDIKRKKDGLYYGSYNTNIVKVKVSVTIKDNKISDIDILEHENGLGSKAEKITNSVIEEQSILVDSVSGATTSSKVILKAIENALKNKGSE